MFELDEKMSAKKRISIYILVGILSFVLMFTCIGAGNLVDRKVMAADKNPELEIDIDEELEKIEREKQEILSQYLPHLDHVEILYTLDEMIKDADVHVDDISFTRPEEEDIEGYVFQYIDISLICEGKYGNLTKLVTNIRECPGNLFISGMSIYKDEIPDDDEDEDDEDENIEDNADENKKKRSKDLLTGKIYIRAYSY